MSAALESLRDADGPAGITGLVQIGRGLYVAGDGLAECLGTPVFGIARINLDTWAVSAFNGSPERPTLSPPSVFSLSMSLVSSGVSKLAVGGAFTSVGGTGDFYRLALLDTTSDTFSQLGDAGATGAAGETGVNADVLAVATLALSITGTTQLHVYAAGRFTASAGQGRLVLNRVLQWTDEGGGAYRQMPALAPASGFGLFLNPATLLTSVTVVALNASFVAIGGNFDDIGDSPQSLAANLAVWDGDWLRPWPAAARRLRGVPMALAVTPSGRLLAAGTVTNGVTTGLLRWNGSDWQDMIDRLSYQGGVQGAGQGDCFGRPCAPRAVAVSAARWWVGGDFDHVGGSTTQPSTFTPAPMSRADGVAYWADRSGTGDGGLLASRPDGSWGVLGYAGLGVSGRVRTLTSINDNSAAPSEYDFVAGGDFRWAGALLQPSSGLVKISARATQVPPTFFYDSTGIAASGAPQGNASTWGMRGGPVRASAWLSSSSPIGPGVVIAGGFTSAPGVSGALRIALFNRQTGLYKSFCSPSVGVCGPAGDVYALTVAQLPGAATGTPQTQWVFIGGSWSYLDVDPDVNAGYSLLIASNVAAFNTDTQEWQPLDCGSGASGGSGTDGVDGTVSALAAYGAALYIGFIGKTGCGEFSPGLHRTSPAASIRAFAAPNTVAMVPPNNNCELFARKASA